MSNLRTKKYVPISRHPFDIHALRKTQQAVNALLNNRVVIGDKPVGTVHNSDSNTVIELPAPPDLVQLQSALPFAFYNTAPGVVAVNDSGTDYLDGNILTLDGGTLAPGSEATTIFVDTVGQGGSLLVMHILKAGLYTDPPTFPNDVTGGAGTGAKLTILSAAADTFKSFAMRSGLISLRSRFFGIEDPGNSYQSPTLYMVGALNVNFLIGNYTRIFSVVGDKNYSLNPPLDTGSNPIIIAKIGDPDTLIVGFKDSGEFVYYNNIILDAKEDEDDYQCAIWLEVIDKADKPGGIAVGGTFQYVNLKARMYDLSSSIAFPITNSANTNPNIIPLAIIHINSARTPEYNISQFQVGNLISRFDTYFNKGEDSDAASGLSAGVIDCYRGDWDADNLDGQYFFPGDWVTQGTLSTADTGGFDIKLSFKCIKYGATDPTGTGSDHWLSLTQ